MSSGHRAILALTYNSFHGTTISTIHHVTNENPGVVKVHHTIPKNTQQPKSLPKSYTNFQPISLQGNGISTVTDDQATVNMNNMNISTSTYHGQPMLPAYSCLYASLRQSSLYCHCFQMVHTQQLR